MKFVSCRAGSSADVHYTLEQCVLGAYAADGGMFLPASLPCFTRAQLRAWAPLSFQQVVLEFMSYFIEPEEISRPELETLIAKSFNAFTKRTEDGQIVREEIGFHALDGATSTGSAMTALRPVTIAELWHGPTLAFKDLPLQFLGNLLAFFLTRAQKRVTILVGTSGDTGSAAIEAVKSCPLANIIVLYPACGRITRLQELQMTTSQSEHENVTVVGVDGSSDELDEPILAVFSRDESFKEKHGLCSINSVNIIRILMQSCHFLYSYLRLCPEADKELDFVLPTGAGGHLVSGILAKKMGLPIGLLCAANNENELLSSLFERGEFTPRLDGAVCTTSPAIDIGLPYNVERVLYLMSPGGHLDKSAAVRAYLHALHDSPLRRFTLPAPELKRWKEFGLRGFVVGQSEVLETMRDTWVQSQYLIDPHTSVALYAAKRLAPGSLLNTHPDVVVFSTAHAAKFLPIVSQATGMSEERLNHMFSSSSPYTAVTRSMGLHLLPERVTQFHRGEDWETRLRGIIERMAQRHQRGAKEAPQQHKPATIVSKL